MTISRAIRQDILHEGLVRTLKALALFWQRYLKLCAGCLRDRLPDGAFTQVFYKIQHVVEHTMTLLAKGTPVLRIQTLVCFLGEIRSRIVRQLIHQFVVKKQCLIISLAKEFAQTFHFFIEKCGFCG